MPETTILGFRRGAPRRLLVARGPQGEQGEIGPPGTTDYNDLLNKPTLGTAAAHAATDFDAAGTAAARSIAMSIALGG